MSIKITGMEKTLLDIKKYTLEQEELFKKAVDETAKEVKANAKSRVPVDTGQLKKDIKIKGKNKGLVKYVYAKGRKKPNGKFFSPNFVESGTPHASAQPFLKPAGKKAESGFNNKVEKIVDRNVVI
ncbi:HK97-gp10 family putative phage morphogenesis protein [Clostridium gasigenes]|uniref:HK97-gp10 family putative phage morphogenesis protein n=1 Tax=Clostridium gasigenes TaxID=94869 RepID=UPI001C0CA179|nr:HK97-gp10 family putative phage morphogenesis protein [Clostridium gasigenes]MBU3102570.1 HK97 gp10 family phage protein [Clostridium gasigenes]